MARKTVHKVRALVLDADGRTYGIVADAAHVLQLPGGSRKETECPRKAIKRECREELGYKVTIKAEAAVVTVRRNGVREITRCYVVKIKGGNGKPKLTGRERARGLRVCQFENPTALRKALSETVSRYGRSAAQRDLKLTRKALTAI